VLSRTNVEQIGWSRGHASCAFVSQSAELVQGCERKTHGAILIPLSELLNLVVDP
jgi:hypothetical protein